MLKLTSSIWRRISLLLLTAFGLVLAGCSATTNAPPLSQASVASSGEYHLVAGDKLRIVIYGERDLSGDFQVDGNGAVNMPLIGAVKAVGLTPTELQNTLVSTYGQGYLRNPNIVVELMGTRPFYIMGEINRPGEYPTTQGLTIAGAIAKAQGFTYRADQKKVYVRRNGEEKEYVADPSKPEYVLPGDIIRVAERYF